MWDCLADRACYVQAVLVNGIHFQEYAKLEYGRLLWRVPAYRERLLRHWRDPRHPHASVFPNMRPMSGAFWKAPRGPITKWMPNCASAT